MSLSCTSETRHQKTLTWAKGHDSLLILIQFYRAALCWALVIDLEVKRVRRLPSMESSRAWMREWTESGWRRFILKSRDPIFVNVESRTERSVGSVGDVMLLTSSKFFAVAQSTHQMWAGHSEHVNFGQSPPIIIIPSIASYLNRIDLAVLWRIWWDSA